MFKMLGITIAQILAAITKLGSAAEKTASALDHLAGWGDDTAAAFADEAKVERQKKLAILNASFAETQKQLEANVAASGTQS